MNRGVQASRSVQAGPSEGGGKVEVSSGPTVTAAEKEVLLALEKHFVTRVPQPGCPSRSSPSRGPVQSLSWSIFMCSSGSMIGEMWCGCCSPTRAPGMLGEFVVWAQWSGEWSCIVSPEGDRLTWHMISGSWVSVRVSFADIGLWREVVILGAFHWMLGLCSAFDVGRGWVLLFCLGAKLHWLEATISVGPRHCAEGWLCCEM